MEGKMMEIINSLIQEQIDMRKNILDKLTSVLLSYDVTKYKKEELFPELVMMIDIKDHIEERHYTWLNLLARALNDSFNDELKNLLCHYGELLSPESCRKITRKILYTRLEIMRFRDDKSLSKNYKQTIKGMQSKKEVLLPFSKFPINLDIPKNEPALLRELAAYIDSYLRENCFLRDDCDNFIQATMEIICEVKKTSKRGQEEINKKFHEEKKKI